MSEEAFAPLFIVDECHNLMPSPFGEDRRAVEADLDRGIDAARGNAVFGADSADSAAAAEEEAREAELLDALATEIDLDGRALRRGGERPGISRGGRNLPARTARMTPLRMIPLALPG